LNIYLSNSASIIEGFTAIFTGIVNWSHDYNSSVFRVIAQGKIITQTFHNSDSIGTILSCSSTLFQHAFSKQSDFYLNIMVSFIMQ